MAKASDNPLIVQPCEYQWTFPLVKPGHLHKGCTSHPEIRDFLKKCVFFQQLPQHGRLRHQKGPRGSRKRGRYRIRTSTHQWLIRHLSSYFYNIHYLSSYFYKIYHIPTMSTLKWVVFVPISHNFTRFSYLCDLFHKKKGKKIFFPTILPNFYNPMTYFSKRKAKEKRGQVRGKKGRKGWHD